MKRASRLSLSVIYIYRNGQDEGPYNLEQVQACLIIGTLSESDFAWFEGLIDWIPLSAAIAQWEQSGHKTEGWRRKVATADQKAEMRFLALKVRRDLTQGDAQDQIDEACKDSDVKSRLDVFRLKRVREKDFVVFLQKNGYRLRMIPPQIGQIRETIDFLQDNVPNWNTETTAEEFASLILSRYPELNNDWDTLDTDGSEIDPDWGTESATDRQLTYLRDLGATVSPNLTKAEASELIDRLCHRASDAQKRRLNFYGLDYDPQITKEQASLLIDCYRERHPKSEDAYQEWKIQNHIQ